MATYIEKWHAWYWTVRSGNRVLYFGPYKNEAEAAERQERGPRGQSLL
jgi:hypothetical protein